MDVKLLLAQMEKEIMSGEVAQAILSEHNQNSEKYEDDRTKAKQALGGLSAAIQADIEELEQLFYAGQQEIMKPAFSAGLFVGFKHYFFPTCLDGLDYYHLVQLPLFDCIPEANEGRLAGIKRRSILETKLKEKITDNMVEPTASDVADAAETDETVSQYYITSIALAGEHRESDTAALSFYFGYRAADAVIRSLQLPIPLTFYSQRIIIEECLGLIQDYDHRSKTPA